MRLRINSLHLLPTSREVGFKPGLNVVAGPITTGKTTLLRFCRILLGSAVAVGDLTPEARERVAALRTNVTIGNDAYDVVRELVSTDTAKVEIAGAEQALRLPALRPDATASTTYGKWLLSRLDLPVIDVPSAPTRPAESTMTPVSINDYMLYCRLSQEEIDSSVFGHNNPFKDIKRRYVFQILYGLYDVDTARLQEELRDLEIQLKTLESESAAFERFLAETPWENRAELERRLHEAEESLAEIRARASKLVEQSNGRPEAQQLRHDIQKLDEEIGSAEEVRNRELRSASQLEELDGQLAAQSGRLTRSIVADSKLLDLEFRVCPRCGAAISQGRGDEDTCYVCLQPPTQPVQRGDLIREQDRIEAQILETRELVASHSVRAEQLSHRLEELISVRERLGHALDEMLQEYVADQAEAIAHVAAERAAVASEIDRLRDYLSLYAKLDRARLTMEEITAGRERVRAAMSASEDRVAVAEDKIQVLERWFANYIDLFDTPRFEGEPRAAIDRDNFLPIVNGRTFGQLSSGGLRTLTNLAYALAHHRAAIELGLPLPGILLIDSIQKNVGRDEYDTQRVEAVFRSLVELSEEVGDDLQLIVTANDVPEIATEFIALNLSADDRLVPEGA